MNELIRPHIIADNIVTSGLIQTVLKRCKVETNKDIRVLLARCLGVIGAIQPNFISDNVIPTMEKIDENDEFWIRKKAPWTFQSVKQQLGLQLLKRHFVIALKAAPTPTDQHKIGFSIQEGMWICFC